MSKKIKKENEVILFTTEDGAVKIEVLFEDENFWLTQAKIAELFAVDRTVVTKHLKNIFEEGELLEYSVSAKIALTAADGKTYNTNFYNLDAIIAVGYRVNSKRATQFRIWATNTLKEYITKGFVLNDEMLKNGRPFGKDYFDELLERIREIRASERRAYQKIADIFEQTSADYDSNSEDTKHFYAFVQNKLHFAVTGKTAAELIVQRADNTKPFMGLTTWKNPGGKILQSDTLVAKNYLNQDELKKLNRIVNMFIDYAEFQTEEGNIIKMHDWLDNTDNFIKFNKQKLLQNFGGVSHEEAVAKAKAEYDKFRIRQDKEYVSKFDKEFEKYLKGKKE
jgi:hypothetical protein